MTWENEADAQRHIPILTEDEELIWSGLGSMTDWLAREREEAGAEQMMHGRLTFDPTNEDYPDNPVSEI